VPLDRLLPHVPILLHNGIKSSRYYADKSASLLIQSDDSRKQAQNRDTCFRKLHELLVEVGRQTVPGETSADQSARVKVLKRAENEARLRAKKQASSKKSSRSKSLND
jgi:peptidyl-tRNA hydrolase ICT1